MGPGPVVLTSGARAHIEVRSVSTVFPEYVYPTVGTGNPPPAAIPFLAGTRIRPGAAMMAARFVLGVLIIVALIGVLITADWFVKAVTSYVPVLP